MTKHILIAAYIFSAVYCYMGLNVLIERSVEEILKRHTSVSFDDKPMGWMGTKTYLIMLAVSLIPLFNLVIGYFFNNISDEKIAEIVSAVEIEHWHELKEIEKITEELDGLDKQGRADSDI